MFRDRQDAAVKLAERLLDYKNKDCVILAIPRGGVIIGYHLARRLNLPLDVIISKKLSHPLSPEYAIGAVTTHGEIISDYREASDEYIASEIRRLRQVIRQKQRMYFGQRKPIVLKGKTVIITDDGVATGSTILAAIEAIRTLNPGRIIVAVPVAPQSSVEILNSRADKFICLIVAAVFHSVGGFYLDFTPVTDEEVKRLLNRVDRVHKAHKVHKVYKVRKVC